MMVLFFLVFTKMGSKFRQVVSIWHDFIWTNRPNLTRFCHVIMKSCQLDTTYVLSYWNRANLTRLLPRHNFLKILLFIYWVVSYVMLKINLIHNFLRVLVLRKKNWIIVHHNYSFCFWSNKFFYHNSNNTFFKPVYFF